MNTLTFNSPLLNIITESIYKLVAVNDAVVYLLNPPLITKTCGLKQWRHVFECLLAGKTMTSEEIVKQFVNDQCLYLHQLQYLDTSLTNRVYVELIEQDWRVAGIKPSAGHQLVGGGMVCVYFGQVYKLIARFASRGCFITTNEFINDYNEIVDPNNNAPQVSMEVLDIIGRFVKEVNKPYECSLTDVKKCTLGEELTVRQFGIFNTTQLIDVKWGNRGQPIGIVKPIQMSGKAIMFVSLTNLDELKQKGLKIGSTVTIKLVHHIIPYIDQVVTTEGQEIVNPFLCQTESINQHLQENDLTRRYKEILKSTRSGKKY